MSRVGKKLKELLARAGMSIFDYNTSIVLGTDHKGRVGTSVAFDHQWGDCVAITYNIEGGREWFVTHVSPAKARLLAMKLIERADYLEKRDGLNKIDTDSASLERTKAKE
jgi:hypothetical protein